MIEEGPENGEGMKELSQGMRELMFIIAFIGVFLLLLAGAWLTGNLPHPLRPSLWDSISAALF